MQVLRMGLPIVESLSGLQESIFSLFRGPQFNSRKKSRKIISFIKFPPLPRLAQVWPMAVWGPFGCCYSCAICSAEQCQQLVHEPAFDMGAGTRPVKAIASVHEKAPLVFIATQDCTVTNVGWSGIKRKCAPDVLIW